MSTQTSFISVSAMVKIFVSSSIVIKVVYEGNCSFMIPQINLNNLIIVKVTSFHFHAHKKE